MSNDKFVIGLDFGTDSVRALLVDVDSGEEKSSFVSYYKRWGKGKYSDSSKNQFRHHPLDYLESLEESIKGVLEKMPAGAGKNIVGIGIDTTGSTPAPVDKNGKVLALKDDFSDNPNAMFILWKDHTAINEAEHINEVAKNWGGTDYTRYEGGVYSSEWFWSKILHVLREDKQVRKEAYSWVELADWIPAVLTENLDPLRMKRSRCAAGHKAMWHEEWGGLPSEEFLVKVDPLLKNLKDRLYKETFTSDVAAGFLTAQWAKKIGLKEGIAVTVGAFDPHMGAVGAGIKDGVFIKVLGTSCCDMAVGPKGSSERLISGICGQVDGSIVPGMLGYEAGQSSFGDVYAWFKEILFWPIERLLPKSSLIDDDLKSRLSDEISTGIIKQIEADAEKLNPDDTGLIALDWLNGRRTPFADQRLKGAIIGLNLGTDAVKMYRAFVEATAFGSKAIIAKFIQDGLVIDEVVAIGGIPQKSSLVMQILADVIDMPVKVAESFQAVALGAAIFGAVASGYYKDISTAQKNMASGFMKVYKPDKRSVETYKRIYKLYQEVGSSLEGIMRKLDNK